RILERQPRHCDGIHARALHSSQTHWRNPVGRSECGGLRRECGAAVRCVETGQRCDRAAALKEVVDERLLGRTEGGNDADPGHRDRTRHGGYVTITAVSQDRWCTRVVAVCAALITCFALRPAAQPEKSDTSFDAIYNRGQQLNSHLKTLTAHFTETTT